MSTNSHRIGAGRARSRAVRARMAATGESYTTALRTLQAQAAAAANTDVGEQWPPLTGLPTIRVAELNNPPGQTTGEPGRWGLIERTRTGWLITPTDYPSAWAAGRAGLVRVDYRDPVTWVAFQARATRHSRT